MERWQDLALERCAQIDEQVSATDQVQIGKRRINHHVLPGEDAHLTDAFVDAVAALRFEEEPLQPLRGKVSLDGIGIDSRARFLQGRVMDVRAENLQGMMPLAVAHELHQCDGDGIHLLARRAPRHPDADRLFRGLVLQQRGEQFLAERLKQTHVAEESGHVDQDVVEQFLELGGVSRQMIGVPLGQLKLVQHHAPPDPTLQRGMLVMSEIHTGTLTQDCEDRIKRLLLGGLLALDFLVGCALHNMRMARDASQLTRNLFRRQHKIHATSGDRAGGHGMIFRRFLVLGEGDATCRLDRQ